MDILKRLSEKLQAGKTDSPPGAGDGALSKYLASNAPQPTQASLDQMLAQLAQVRIIEGGMGWDRPLGNRILAEASDSDALAALKKALRIVDGSGGHCMCDGEPTLELLAEGGKPLALIGLHHGLAIRWKAWKDDARLVEGMELLEWLDACGVPGPLKDYMDALVEQGAALESWKLWAEAMPECLREFPEETWERALGRGDLFPILAALVKAYPGSQERALALFHWAGHSGEDWSGYPEYEQLPFAILGQFRFEEVVRAAESAALTAAQSEGAARFFGTYDPKKPLPLPSSLQPMGEVIFRPARSDLARIPATLRRSLLRQSLLSSIEARRRSAEAAFLTQAQREFIAQVCKLRTANTEAGLVVSGEVSLLASDTPFHENAMPLAIASFVQTIDAAVIQALAAPKSQFEIVVHCVLHRAAAPDFEISARGEAGEETTAAVHAALGKLPQLTTLKDDLFLQIGYAVGKERQRSRS